MRPTAAYKLFLVNVFFVLFLFEAKSQGAYTVVVGSSHLFHVTQNDAHNKYIWGVYYDDDCSFDDEIKKEDKIFEIEGEGSRVNITFWVKGEYYLLLTEINHVGGANCANFSKKKIIVKDGFFIDLGEDINICPGDSLYLKPDIIIKNNYILEKELSYRWEGVESNEKIVKIKREGFYKVIVSDGMGNSLSDDIFIGLHPQPFVDLGDDKIIEKGKPITLFANNIFKRYLWSNGSIYDKIDVCDEGVYWLRVKDENNCTASDTVKVSFDGNSNLDIPELKIPNAFSPNGDGLNDKLYLLGDINRVKQITFSIFRRDGLKIFETKNIDEGWDGSYKGKIQNMDVYIYFFKVLFDNNKSYGKKGSVNLIR